MQPRASEPRASKAEPRAACLPFASFLRVSRLAKLYRQRLMSHLLTASAAADTAVEAEKQLNERLSSSPSPTLFRDVQPTKEDEGSSNGSASNDMDVELSGLTQQQKQIVLEQV